MKKTTTKKSGRALSAFFNETLPRMWLVMITSYSMLVSLEVQNITPGLLLDLFTLLLIWWSIKPLINAIKNKESYD